jgi:5-methylcytosine-specific restriction endonuclease McrA
MKNFPLTLHATAVTMAELDMKARTACKRLGQAEWELAQLLAEMQQRGRWHELGCSSMVDYAERQLGMPADHLFALLRLFNEVERFPLASQAWRDGEIGRAKLRELVRVITPATEQRWVDFARQHSCREVERQVVLRPRQVKAARHSDGPAVAAAGATVDPAVVAAGPAVVAIGAATEPAAAATDSAAVCATDVAAGSAVVVSNEVTVVSSITDAADHHTEQPELLPESAATSAEPMRSSPRLVRVQLTFEPAEYATIEAALDLLRASGCGRSREKLFVEMAQRVLARSDARTRRRHAVVVEKDANTGEVAYVTGRGYLPTAPQAVLQMQDSHAGKKKDPVGRRRGSNCRTAAIAVAQDAPQTGNPPASADSGASGRPAEAIATELNATTPYVAPGVCDAGQVTTPCVAPVNHVVEANSTSTATAADRENHETKVYEESAQCGNTGPNRPAKNEKGRTRLPSAVERAVLERAGYACERCGRRQGLQVHHVDRVCRGGTHDPATLALLCNHCHRSEHGEEFSSDVTFLLGRAYALAARAAE